MADQPTDDDLKRAIAKLIPTVDLQSTGIKAFIKLLSKEFGGADLKARNKFIKKALEEAINAMSSDEEDSNDDDEEEEAAVEAKAKKPKGLAQKKKISKKLAAFLGKGDTMARTEIVKALWEYIREHNLQHPENKREIILDDKMKEVFGCDQFSMFAMNKYISVHVDPFKPLDLTTKPKPEKSKTKRKRGSKDDGKPKAKRKAGAQPPYRLSPELQLVVGGKEILPRPQVVKALWVYIKANGLQNPENKREILCDDKLKAIMNGKDKVTMFNMNSFVGQHLVEKLDKSAYQHEDDADADAKDTKVAAVVKDEEVDDDDDDNNDDDDDNDNDDDDEVDEVEETGSDTEDED